jgi:dUTP pyrophosphatase
VIKNGMKIAQGVIAPIMRAEFIVVSELSDTSRGDGGYGSTGV